jgi:protein-disulfide isomerase
MNHEPLVGKYKGKVRFVYKHFPLSNIHPMAMDAAIASQCAHRSGKFWEYQDLIFRNQQVLSQENLSEWGKKLGLGDAFQRCFKEKATRAEVEQDLKDGMSSGVRGTPTFFINGAVIPGALPLTHFEEAIEKNL